MIEINLLPPEHRPVERTPLPRFLTILAGVLLTAMGLILWSWLSLVKMRDATNLRDEYRARVVEKQPQADEVKEIEADLDRYRKREEVLRTLYKERIRWGRVLDRLAEARRRTTLPTARGGVILTELELKQTAARGRASRGQSQKQLHVKGYVPGFEKETAADLSESVVDFVKVLSSDELWKKIFLDEEPEYRSYEFDADISGAAFKGTAKAKGAKSRTDLPKVGLKFHVVFTFKPLELPKTSSALAPAAGARPVAAKH